MKTIRWDDWSGFIPISFAPGLGGEFFAHLIHYRHQPFDPSNFPFNRAGKFSYVNEQTPLKWNTDKSLFGWYMKSPYVNTVADHDLLAKKLGYGDLFLDAFPSRERFDKLSFAVACFGQDNGIHTMDVNDDKFINYIKNFNFDRSLHFKDYQIAVVHPFFRWFTTPAKYNHFPNAKAIQMYCDPSKGWLFYLLSFSKMYDFYLAYVRAGETFRKEFFDNLEENFIGRVDKKYAKDFAQPILRTVNDDFHFDSFEAFFNKKDYSDQLSSFLKENFTLPKQAIDYYYDINTKIINHFDLDPSDNYVPGKVVFEKFKQKGPYYFEDKKWDLRLESQMK